MEGWAKLHRKIIEWQWFKDQNTLQIFIYLIMVANHKTGFAGHGIEVKKGQRLTSVQAIMEGTGLSTKQVRNSLARLEKSGEIEVKGANKYSLITICNYGKYQDLNAENDNDGANKGQTRGKQRANEGQTEGNQRANEGQTEGKQRATNNNNKNNKNEENEENEKMKEENLSVDSGESTTKKTKPAKADYSKPFEDLWLDLLQSNRAGDSKKTCAQRYETCRKDGLTHEQIVAGCQYWASTNDSRANEYRKGLSAWLYAINVRDALAGHVVVPTKSRKDMTFEERVLDGIKDFDFSKYETRDDNDQPKELNA